MLWGLVVKTEHTLLVASRDVRKIPTYGQACMNLGLRSARLLCLALTGLSVCCNMEVTTS